MLFHNIISALSWGTQARRCTPTRILFSPLRQVMAVLSVLTPVLAAVLCLVIGVMLVKSRETETTSTSLGKTKEGSKADFRPWVDQDLQDDTDTTVREDGKSWTETFVLVPGWTFFTSSMIKCFFRDWENCPIRLNKLKTRSWERLSQRWTEQKQPN